MELTHIQHILLFLIFISHIYNTSCTHIYITCPLITSLANFRRSNDNPRSVHPHPHTVATEVRSHNRSFSHHNSINKRILFLDRSRCRVSLWPYQLWPWILSYNKDQLNRKCVISTSKTAFYIVIIFLTRQSWHNGKPITLKWEI